MEKFFEILGVDNKFILTSDKQGEWRATRFSNDLVDKYDRISLGATISPVSYNIDTALYTKVLAVLDIDTKDIYDIDMFLSKVPHTVKLETNRGYHFIWLCKDYLNIRDENGNVLEDYDTFLTINTYLKNLTYKLKQSYPVIDKFFNINYTRMPRSGRVCEITDVFYTPLDFLSAIDKLVFGGGQKSSISDFEALEKPTAKSIFTLNQLLSTEENCPTLRNLIQNPSLHSYDDWVVLSRHFANKIILSTNQTEEKAIELLFHSIASKHPDYNQSQNEKLLRNHVEKGFVPLSCKILSTLPLSRCSDCPYKTQPVGTAYSISETIAVPSYLQKDLVVQNGSIYHIYSDEDTVKLFYMARDFSILDIVEISQADGVYKFAKLHVDNDEKILLFDKNNKPENLGVILDSNPKYNKKLSELFMFNYQLKSNSKKSLPEVIDYFERGFFSVDKFTRFKIRSQNLYPETMFEENGEFEEWKKAYSQAFQLDEVIRISTGLYLSQYFISYGMKHILPLNPILLIVGITGAGKTLRASIVNSLFYFPETRLSKEGAYSTSIPYLASIQAKVRLPFHIDEIRVITNQDEEIFKELIYYISNGTPRNNLKGRQYPLKSSVLMTGELKNTTFIHRSEVDGINRRLLTITLSAIDITKIHKLADILQVLHKNYGFGYKFFDNFEFNDSKFYDIRNKIKDVASTVFPTIQNVLSAIYYMSSEFAYFLGTTYSIDDFIKDIQVIRLELNQDPVYSYIEEHADENVTVNQSLALLTDIIELMRKQKAKILNKSKIEFQKRQFNPFYSNVKTSAVYNEVDAVVNILLFKPISRGNIRYVTDTTNILFLLSEENNLSDLGIYFTRLQKEVLNAIYSYINKKIYSFEYICELLPHLKEVLLKFLEEKSPSSSVSLASEVISKMGYLHSPDNLKLELTNLTYKLNNKNKLEELL